MTFDLHCERSREILGEPFCDIHRWLDEYYGHPRYRTKHRRLRHHRQGIEQVRKRWGDRAAEAAELHVLDDLQTGECRNADETWIPRDEEDYVSRGYW